MSTISEIWFYTKLSTSALTNVCCLSALGGFRETLVDILTRAYIALL